MPKSKSKSPAAAPKNEEAEDDHNGSDSDVPEDEYEIDEILDDDYGVFDGAPNQRCFFVSWKGYPASENCWITEADAGNAKELIEDYTRRLQLVGKTMKQKPGKGGRKSQATTSSQSKGKKRESSSTPVRTSSSSSKRAKGSTFADVTTSRRSGRNSSTGALTPAQQRKEEKKLSKDAASASLSRLSGSNRIIVDGEEVDDTEGDEDDDEDPRGRSRKQRAREMLQYEARADWEGVVDAVESIERTATGGLAIFLRFVNGERHAYESHVANYRCPQKVIEFYESRLRFRPLPGEACTSAEQGAAANGEEKQGEGENQEGEGGKKDAGDVQAVGSEAAPTASASELKSKQVPVETSPDAEPEQEQPQQLSSGSSIESQMDVDTEAGSAAAAAMPIVHDFAPAAPVQAAAAGPSVQASAWNGSGTVADANGTTNV